MSDGRLWEIFIRPRGEIGHRHVGSVHAPDAELALDNARDVFTRRQEGVSIWAVPSSVLVASPSDDEGPQSEPAADKSDRHPTSHEAPWEFDQR